jgi:hypothetical protein
LSGESPRSFENRTIEPGFLPHTTAWLIRRALSRSGHVANLQILEHQQQRLEIVDQLSASLMRKVAPQIGGAAPLRARGPSSAAQSPSACGQVCALELCEGDPVITLLKIEQWWKEKKRPRRWDGAYKRKEGGTQRVR